MALVVFSSSINWYQPTGFMWGEDEAFYTDRQISMERTLGQEPNPSSCIFIPTLAKESRRAFPVSPHRAFPEGISQSWLGKLEHSCCFPSIQLLCPEPNPSLSQGMAATALQRSAGTGCLHHCAINRVEKGSFQLFLNWFSWKHFSKIKPNQLVQFCLCTTETIGWSLWGWKSA